MHVPGKPPIVQALEGPLSIAAGEGLWFVDKARGSGEPIAIELSPRADGVLVQTKPGARVVVRHEGRAITEVLVPWGDEVFVQGARLTFVLDASSADRVRALVLGLGGVAVVAASLFGLRALRSQAQNTYVDPPALVGSQLACPETDAQAAESRARDAEGSGLAKRERYPFDPADGPEALSLLREAAACFGTAGRTQDAARADAAAREWEERLNSDYTALHTRLRVALERNQSGEALGAAKELELLLSRSGEHPYRVWLGARRQELEKTRKVAQKGEK
jgi:hypothetical protein